MKHLIIIGGGPAGVTAAIYGARSGMNVTLLTGKEGALTRAAKVDNYYGFPHGISGLELMEMGQEQGKNLGVVFVYEEVVSLSKEDKFVVSTAEKDYMADAVILAMGAPRKAPKIEGIKEFEGKGVSYCAICDGFFFRNKDVAVLGSGEYANHEAEVLKPIAKTVTMIDEGLAQLRGDTRLKEAVFADGRVMPIDGLFVAQGTAGSNDLAKKIGAIMSGSNIVVSSNMETNIEGLFAAGDCTGGLLQISKAVYQGTVAGLGAVKFLKSK